MTSDKMTYAGVGVDYESMDPFKRMAQLAARSTASQLVRFGLEELEESRGESAYLIGRPDGSYLAHVEEGLGTKNLVADAMYTLTGTSFYNHVAQCTVAMIVNDLITLGALPLSVAMHLASGDSDWFKDEKRCHDLVDGWARACMLARCAWGGGETPTLKGIVMPGTVVLAGSAIGMAKPGQRIRGNIQHGDAIILIESSGIHANGLSMARKIAEKLPEGYLTRLPNGRTYGETLLDPTMIYVALMEKLLDADVSLHYAVNITGHGWRKLMRARENFTYTIEALPQKLPIFDFMQQHGPIDDTEAYGNFNMGAGFALYVPQSAVVKVLDVVTSFGGTYRAINAGYIERSDVKKVVIRPKNLVYAADTLAVR